MRIRGPLSTGRSTRRARQDRQGLAARLTPSGTADGKLVNRRRIRTRTAREIEAHVLRLRGRERELVGPGRVRWTVSDGVPGAAVPRGLDAVAVRAGAAACDRDRLDVRALGELDGQRGLRRC